MGGGGDKGCLLKGTAVKKVLPPHPTQPIVRDKHGELRFRGNAIVRCLLDRNGGGLEGLANLDVPPEDHVQLAQLLGHAVDDCRFNAIRSTLPAHVATTGKKKRYDPQPMQPVHQDAHGTIRFRRNELVNILLDRDSARGRIYPDFPARTDGGLNWIAMQNFSQEDQEQLAQLIGYSVSSYHELSYVSNRSAAQASALAVQDPTQRTAKM